MCATMIFVNAGCSSAYESLMGPKRGQKREKERKKKTGLTRKSDKHAIVVTYEVCIYVCNMCDWIMVRKVKRV